MEPTKLSKLNDFFKSYISFVSGHDKLARFVQYSTRFIIPSLYKISERYDSWEKFAKQYERILNSTKRELSTARRTLRIFKQFQVLWTVFKLIKNFKKNQKIPFKKEGCLQYVILKSINNILASIFFSLDHVFWAYMIKLHRNRDLVGKVGDFCDYVWIVQSCANITMCMVEMGINQAHIKKLRKRIRKLRKFSFKSNEEDEDEGVKEEDKIVSKIESLEEANAEIPLEVIKSVCDSITALYFLDRDYFSDWMIGLVGCLASVISMYRIGNMRWKRLNN